MLVIENKREYVPVSKKDKERITKTVEERIGLHFFLGHGVTEKVSSETSNKKPVEKPSPEKVFPQIVDDIVHTVFYDSIFDDALNDLNNKLALPVNHLSR